MAAKNKFMNAMKMPAIADMFSSEADRQRESGDLVTEVPLSELHPFVNHPFEVRDDEDKFERGVDTAVHEGAHQFDKAGRKGVKTTKENIYKTKDGIQNFNTIFKKNISNTYLGNFHSPYLSNIFITRETVQDFYPLTQIRAFLFKPEDALLFNTTTPFTRLNYFTG